MSNVLFAIRACVVVVVEVAGSPSDVEGVLALRAEAAGSRDCTPRLLGLRELKVSLLPAKARPETDLGRS
mgnify:CR=1 FL=1